jgi:hypothetical protein
LCHSCAGLPDRLSRFLTQTERFFCVRSGDIPTPEMDLTPGAHYERLRESLQASLRAQPVDRGGQVVRRELVRADDERRTSEHLQLFGREREISGPVCKQLGPGRNPPLVLRSSSSAGVAVGQLFVGQRRELDSEE